jgi:hypothetical protein
MRRASSAVALDKKGITPPLSTPPLTSRNTNSKKSGGLSTSKSSGQLTYSVGENYESLQQLILKLISPASKVTFTTPSTHYEHLVL